VNERLARLGAPVATAVGVVLDLDRWREIGETLGRHPMRTALTMGSVAWGTFVLVVLLGVGQGLQNSVRWQFRDDATNSLWVFRGQTSRPFAGTTVGKPIQLDIRDFDAIEARIDEIDHITARYSMRGGVVTRYGERSAQYAVRSVHPDHLFLEHTLVVEGRFIDDLDLRERRKVAVIGRRVSDYLFRGSSPIGTYVEVAGLPFQVVGVFEDVGGEGEMEQIYLPLTTGQAVFGGFDQVHQIMFTVGDATPAEAEAIEGEVRELLAARHRFDPADAQAVRVRNNVEEFERLLRIFELLDAFVWLVGAGTVTAGLVGVSNITLVSVRERTAELALRKALGATPAAIVGGVVQEAVTLTAVSGYVGIVLGVAVLSLVQSAMPENDYLRDPEIHLEPALLTAALLVLAGAVAGSFPAWLAARVPPATGLRDA
jgi:putative ABC transport system permease protein